jgi:transcriptional regulator with XRE-family HTH domain
MQLSVRQLSVEATVAVLFTFEKVATPLQQQFGTLVRRRREAVGLSQEALADKAGLHRTYISLLERGRRMPSIEVVRKLAAALETTMTSLVAELEDPEGEAADDGPSRPRPKK